MDILRWKRIKYGDRVIKMRDWKHTILYDANRIELVKITTEVYDILEDMTQNGNSICDILEQCDSQKDREYFLGVCSLLAEKNIIWDYDDMSEYISMDIQIDLDLTNSCNLRCKHCCVSAGECNNDLDTESMIEIIDKVVSIKPVSITISGGEPLIRKDFCLLIENLRKKYSGKLSLMTNAILVTPILATFISEHFDDVSISLDGVDEETCSVVRGPGVFQKTIDGIKLLQKAGVENISLSMVLTSHTISRQKRFKELCKQLNVYPCIRGLSLIGRAEKEMQEMVPSMEDLMNSCEDREEMERNADRLHTLFTCGAAYTQFQVGHTGDIYPCHSLMDSELVLGNVFEIEDLYDYIRKRQFVNTDGYRILEQYFPYQYGDCKKCNKSVFCWNCIEDLYHQKDAKPYNSFCNVPFEDAVRNMLIV